MPQTTQDKRGNWQLGEDGKWAAPIEVIHHGDSFTFADENIPTNTITSKGFLGGVDGLIENTTLGAQIANSGPWRFDNSSIPGIIVNDATRGKVIYSDYNGAQLNNVQGWDSGAAIPPNTKYYASWYARCAIKTTGGVPFPDGTQIQWKNLRVIDQDHVEDTASNAGCEFIMFNWKGGAGAQHRIENEVLDYLGYAPDASVYPDINAGWAKIEYFIDTGSVGVADGTYIVRIHKNGHVYTGISKVGTEKFYGSTKRHRFFNIQNYFGNGGVAITGKEIWIDGFSIQVGTWRRCLLVNSLDLAQASIQIDQPWSAWSAGNVAGKYDCGGITASGKHYLVVANGTSVEAFKPKMVNV